MDDAVIVSGASAGAASAGLSSEEEVVDCDTYNSFGSDFEVDYGSQKHASIVHDTLAVDKELQPDKVKREMSVSDGRLVVHFEAVEARFLRASFSAFVDLMILVTKLVEEYGNSDPDER